MYGMELMKEAVSPLQSIPEFSNILTAFNNPLLGVLVGAVFTGVIQSSAASVGILQALAMTGSITFGMAIPIIMGQNIGTCVTAILSSIGVSRSAKRVAAVHISFNIIGTVVCLILFYGMGSFLPFTFMDDKASAVSVALCHTIFNVFTTAMLMPFSSQLEKLACILVKSETKSEQFAFLDPLLLRTPGAAINECTAMVGEMSKLAHKNFLLSIQQLESYSTDRETQILENEDKLDTYEDRLGDYLVQISRHGLSGASSRQVSRMLHCIGDFERIGDHAVNVQESAQELHDKQLTFSDSAKRELEVLIDALRNILSHALDCFSSNDPEVASHVEPLEETIDRLIEEIRLRHIERLQSGVCTIQLGFVLNDLLTNFERVSDHCSNIAVCVIDTNRRDIDAHVYLHNIKQDSSFMRDLQTDMNRYTLPNP